MADKKHLLNRKGNWYVQLAVPLDLQETVGRATLVKALGTKDLGEANRLKWAVLADMQAQFTRAKLDKTLPKESAAYVLNVAKQLRAEMEAQQITQGEAEEQLGYTVGSHLDRLEKKHGVDEEGYARIDEQHTRAIRLAHQVLHSGDVALLDDTIKDYLAENSARLRKQTLAEISKHLSEFAGWMGNAEVTTITKRIAGRYLSEKLLRKGHSPVTTKDTLHQFSGFWNWLEGRGYVESNPWHGLSRTVKADTKGKEASRRPWEDAELQTLLTGIPNGDPLLPMCMIGPYTGMRREEIALLKLTDVSADDALIVRQGKTKAAVRRVPIHPAIKPLIAKLVATSSDGYLIPGLLTGGADDKRGHYVGKRFTEVRRRIGLTDPALDFHAFRHSLIQRCENAEVPESTTKLLAGHARGITYGTYSPGPNFEKLRQAMHKVTYGPIDALCKKQGGKVEVTKQSKRRRKSVKARAA